MNRRVAIQLACAMLIAPGLVRAQARKQFRIGWFLSGKKADPMSLAFVREFRARLAELGYVEGKNLVIDMRFGEADAARFPAIAADLNAGPYFRVLRGKKLAYRR